MLGNAKLRGLTMLHKFIKMYVAFTRKMIKLFVVKPEIGQNKWLAITLTSHDVLEAYNMANVNSHKT